MIDILIDANAQRCTTAPLPIPCCLMFRRDAACFSEVVTEFVQSQCGTHARTGTAPIENSTRLTRELDVQHERAMLWQCACPSAFSRLVPGLIKAIGSKSNRTRKTKTRTAFAQARFLREM
jgi:hypothetical protein